MSDEFECIDRTAKANSAQDVADEPVSQKGPTEHAVVGDRVNLLGLTRSQMKAFFESIGEKGFRAQQVMKWIHHHNETDFAQMTNLSKLLRERLAQVSKIEMPEVTYRHFSQDGTRKWVLQLDEKNAVETVFIPDGRRGTLCVSSQVGCALDCDFCSTGKQGFQRDLTVHEIMAQIWIAQASFGPRDNLGQSPITNVVFMGMGEPLLNFGPVTDAAELMMDDLGYGLSKRRVTISTSGIIPALDELGDRLDVSLALSLHATNDALRDQLVPINKRYPIEPLLAACRRYLARYSDRKRVTVEYVMLDGVNDTAKDARALVRLLAKLPNKVNLIPFNPFPHAPYRRSSDAAIARFQKILLDAGLIATVRRTRGDDIDAACGQLVGQVTDRTRRQAQWAARIEAQNLP